MPASRKDSAKPLSVWQLNQQAKSVLESEFHQVAVVGEVSNLKVVSGHWYFTLKDDRSQLPCVMFRREADQVPFRVEHGQQLVARGRLTLYPPYGRYQLVAHALEPQGLGALQAAYEQLRNKLATEGLFNDEKKRSLPLLPRNVAVVTSATGAVIRDIVHVAQRRFPKATILLFPSRVQGADAAHDLCAALDRVEAKRHAESLDVVIIGRGGGSMEDLWCFNDENLARRLAAFPIPVVSAVGHETDFSISDFVADVRAPTPSAAAELVFPLWSELKGELVRHQDRLRQTLMQQIRMRRIHQQSLQNRLKSPVALVQERKQRLDYAIMQCAQAVQKRIASKRLALKHADFRFEQQHPKLKLANFRSQIKSHEHRLWSWWKYQKHQQREQLNQQTQRLQVLSPLNILQRVYAIALNQSGQVVRAATQVHVGEQVQVRTGEGQISAQVTHVEAGKSNT